MADAYPNAGSIRDSLADAASSAADPGVREWLARMADDSDASESSALPSGECPVSARHLPKFASKTKPVNATTPGTSRSRGDQRNGGRGGSPKSS